MAYYFKLLRGLHSEGRDEKGNPIVYKKGDCFESKSDLSKHNYPQSHRFQVLNALPEKMETATAVSDGYNEEELKSLKLAELVQICQDEEIDLTNVPKRKKELISKILELGA